jgi:hypothetical protein
VCVLAALGGAVGAIADFVLKDNDIIAIIILAHFGLGSATIERENGRNVLNPPTRVIIGTV